ncbi:Gfo/Idh/MocA family protein [Flavobacterium muglaense]|uniref:Gfo/Idh/MocA family oxidoreductase n=1 Tax=Flavobacterium muglaense TaxID=2764716 RepID=A0A923N1Y2_9FLAO|nr:Gfo/Idh/MocA family oxidoreductase [Flavobacterium muglaense]MBC5837691.1 Gfo/Idh/MocA family oxidoreductase [Flavobacterium muglaense]MBC5844193.1 Gfo/Idh/MocA family oxidoreductase [Flavobacterium muglaense]
MNRKLKMGMIGGGKNAFIGAIHRIAANMDGLIELHCGAFSSDPATSIESGKALFLPESKCYASYPEMIRIESQLPIEERMDFVSIVTPNFAHFDPAMMALDHGFNVVIDKPMTLTLAEAKKLEEKVKETGLLLCLTHTYSGYPMVKQARAMVANQQFGSIRKVIVEYPQGWLSNLTEKDGNKQAVWRTDPTKSGISGCMGDIGTHAAQLGEYISGLKITQLCADINIVVEGRKLDDDGNVLLKFDNGANGVLIASQIATGEENSLKIKVFGEKGGLEWHQMEPNTLIIKWPDAPAQIYRAGNDYLSNAAQFNTRTPSGHPEGYLEAFANLYRNFALTLRAKIEGGIPTAEMLDFPSVADGVRGMAFIEHVIASGKSDQKWYAFKI